MSTRRSDGGAGQRPSNGPAKPEHQPTWEEVLASFEATADAAESLLQPGFALDAHALNATVRALSGLAATHDHVEYDPVQLALPELPVALHARARAIQERHAALSARLQRSSQSLRQQEQFVLRASAGSRNAANQPSIYLDRSA